MLYVVVAIDLFGGVSVVLYCVPGRFLCMCTLVLSIAILWWCVFVICDLDVFPGFVIYISSSSSFPQPPSSSYAQVSSSSERAPPPKFALLANFLG